MLCKQFLMQESNTTSAVLDSCIVDINTTSAVLDSCIVESNTTSAVLDSCIVDTNTTPAVLDSCIVETDTADVVLILVELEGFEPSSKRGTSALSTCLFQPELSGATKTWTTK